MQKETVTKKVYIDYLFDNYNLINKRRDSQYYFMLGDEQALKKYNASCKNDNSKIITNLIPQPLCGNLLKGDIFLCSLNPSFREEDLYLEGVKKSTFSYPNYKQSIINLLLQSEMMDNSMFYISEKPADCDYRKNSPGSKYWRNRLNQSNKEKSLVCNLTKELRNKDHNVNEDDVFQMLANRIVTLELFPYHSYKFDRSLLNPNKYSFKSVNMMKSFVHDDLIPKAKEKDVLVVFLRSFKAWGVDGISETDHIILNKANVQRITFGVDYNVGRAILNFILRKAGNE